MPQAVAGQACRLYVNGHDISKHVRSVDLHAAVGDAVLTTLVLYVLPRIDGTDWHLDLGIPPKSAIGDDELRPVGFS